ncbi:glycosyltransferase family 2 protein [Flavobacterium psychrophilum]|uniref:glycosyltransferase family 2 protein n=1 Tax=Flavobacterium psychrophilum TaxID=96345 RepID=UPI000B7C274B|nr:glycosyltransferase family A protein [Flavobacterium psychrophilum]EKT4549366.1 glycosyltransferase family 2 protein [Flavobacterium psychrophilum]ELY1978024.1 glycosyltransferase family 2 protein [Flavobacterium psychrophilum]ELY2017044.1 glycosyltransferase family 2 protein [Flavobacterium psychrophilum]SNB00285.1 Glycosyl transferase, group 2 family protein [Flavobacterium psychrophilum]SNB07183.1 Glycosyl transferase, group 2 family protein [Flavobacterium psychrophilum]
MKYYIIIPAHNEESFLGLTLQSIIEQTILPSKIVIVNDNSTDKTENIALAFAEKNPIITLVNTTSQAIHLPGSKVIQAFNKGLETVNDDYDFIVKADADLIFPTNYFETIINHFKSDSTIGMVGGFAYVEKNKAWILENLTDKDHIRGAFKAYRKATFKQIGGLKPAMGWDTVDELLCKFYHWKVVTDQSLQVKHLKPTGANYNKTARYKQGEAFYSLGYGFFITAIASAKLAMMKKKPLLFLDYIKGFWKAKLAKKPLLVSQEQAKYIRKYRWQKMKSKIL